MSRKGLHEEEVLSLANTCLLSAACRGPTDAEAAWRQWLTLVDIEDHHDADVYRLLPQICRNLEGNEGNDLHTSVLHGVQRKTWYQNRLVVREGLRACGLLDSAGIEYLVVRDTGLAAAYVQSSAARPIENFEILVECARIEEAHQILTMAGWEVVGGKLSGAKISGYRTVLRGAGGRHVTFRAELFPDAGGPSAWSSIRHHSVVGHLDTKPLLVPGACHQLLSVCAPAEEMYKRSLLRRVHDVITVLQSHHRLDIEVFIQEARRRHLVVTVEEVLTAIDSIIPELVPHELASSLRRIPRARWEEAEKLRRNRDESIGRLFWRVWYEHRRRAGSGNSIFVLTRFPTFLRERWDLDSLWQIPRRAIAQLRRRVRHERSGRSTRADGRSIDRPTH